jgi:hypothetical protein
MRDRARVRYGSLLLGFIWALILVPALVWAAGDAPAVAVRTGEHPDRSRIVFDWSGAVGATVDASQAGQLVVAFDRPAGFDLSKASLKHLSRVAALEAVAGKSAVRITLRGAHGYKLSDVNGKVVLDILDDPGATPALKTQTKPAKTKTSSKNAAASPPPQGSAANGRPGQAPDAAPPFLAVREPAMEAAQAQVPVPAPSEPVPDPLFDPQTWHGGGTFGEAAAALPKVIGSDPKDAGAMLKLAQFYFAWRRGDEALSALDLLPALDPKLAKRIDVQALAEASRILARRPRAMTGLFDRPYLREKPEVQLWRGAAAATAGRVADAFQAFEAGKPALAGYPPEFQAFFSLLALEASLDRDALSAAESYRAVAEAAQPRDEEAGMLEALTGRLLAAEHRTDEARQHLQRALRSPALRPQILAQLALVRLDRDAGKLADDAAITALEQVYYSWEGDALQLDAIDQLAPLLIATKKYDKAFALIAAAQRQFPNEARTVALAKRAHDLYRQLMTATGPDALDPVATAALFDAHRELLPGGPQGIAIQQALAKRLAQLDLVEPASRILDDALKAAPADQQAAIATDIADLRLAAGDTDGALKALDSSKGATVPAKLVDRRAQLQAQALADSGHDIEALAAVGTAAAPADDHARADLYWRNGEWELAAKDYLAAAGAPGKDGTVGDRDAHLILRATAALMLAGKTADIAAIHDKYGAALAKSPVAAVFDKLTKAEAGVEVLAQPDVSAEIVKLD